MEVGIPQIISGLEKSFNSTSRLNIDGIPKNTILDVKLAAQAKQLTEQLELYNDKDDEGEIMLLAMILLQLHGVKLPTTHEDDRDDDMLNKKKRQRTSPDQLAILEQIFQTDKMPNQQTRVHLADQLGMSSRRVQIWFQNKRAKVKRSVSKNDTECSSPNSLNSSSSSIDSPSSPSSPSASPSLYSSSPAQLTTTIPLLLDALAVNAAAAPIVSPTTSQTPSTSSFATTVPTPSPATTTQSTTTDNTSLLKQQFSRPNPFVEKQPSLLAASY